MGKFWEEDQSNPRARLVFFKNCYGRGSWASCLRFHNSTYYVSMFSSTSGRTHIYMTANIEKGDWKEQSFSPLLHDHSLFFDDNGHVYMLYAAGNLRLVELKPDLWWDAYPNARVWLRGGFVFSRGLASPSTQRPVHP